MWDIKIGEGPFGNSAVGVSGDMSELSENALSYWYQSEELDMGCMLDKRRPEAAKVKEFVEQKRFDAAREYLDALLVQRTSPKDLAALIKRKYKQGLRDGERSIKAQFRELLGF